MTTRLTAHYNYCELWWLFRKSINTAPSAAAQRQLPALQNRSQSTRSIVSRKINLNDRNSGSSNRSMPKIPIETFWFNIHFTMCRSDADPIIIIICVVCWCHGQSVKRHLFFYTQVCFIYLLDIVNVRSDTWYYNLTYARDHIDDTKNIKIQKQRSTD